MQRSAASQGKKGTMRGQPLMRSASSKNLAPSGSANGRVSPADSSASAAPKPLSPPQNGAVKRKEREYEIEGGEETNINVVVRCRGRSDREVRENSGVVVSTDGIKGKAVELSMGPNALSNKTYHFDKVFSPAADQGMVFDEVVAPILDEVLSGFNCTIFAYGQTGTGKTYTMSGDISDTLPLPDEAGIIPRVLHALFSKLEADGCENSVKCSFIELYNEELRDLLSADESFKLKIFDDAGKKSQASTLVQGMEESYIKGASRGIELLRDGSHKRQVAATKCNDLSSRSHTVFTITVYMKKVADAGEEFVSAGKLNLVDLAGSENIQRSGAENKRAAEAGLINKSLLTLGRVINALVDKNSHIPYRESKLTRLLQDSLGGRTKTCIIATLSPAKSNLEETISTLDYAFRAKNIRNKPQTNQLISKKTLFREFTTEIEKYKAELIATRQRNGVYLTSEAYEEMTIESESRRILTEEQRDKIETMEANLRNKAHELFALTTSFNNLRKDNEAVRQALAGTQSVLEKTEIVLEHTRQSLAEENMLRKAHEATEDQLADIGKNLVATLQKTTADIGGLHSKIQRKVELQTLNRSNWSSSQDQVSNTTNQVQQRMKSFESQHERFMSELSSRMTAFVNSELSKLTESKTFLDSKTTAFGKSEMEVNAQTRNAHDNMNEVLEEIKTLREDVKQKVGDGLDGLSVAAQKISAGVITELEAFNAQLHSSFSSLGKEFRNAFDELTKHINQQRAEVNELRQQLQEAGVELTKANDAASTRLNTVLAEEKERAAADRNKLIVQMTALLNSHGEEQDKRLEDKIRDVQGEIATSRETFQKKQDSYNQSMDNWSTTETSFLEEISKSREAVKNKIKKDWTAASERNSSIQATTHSVHEETVRIVDDQMRHMDVQLQSLDEILSRVRTQNSQHHEAHVQSLSSLASTVKQSYSNINGHLDASSERIREFGTDVTSQTTAMGDDLKPFSHEIHGTLDELRTTITSAPIIEYVPTGQTPQRGQYQYTSTLPRTESHDVLLENFRHPTLPTSEEEVTLAEVNASPSKTAIYTDPDTRDLTGEMPSPTLSKKMPRPESAQSSLRELDANVAPSTMKSDTTITICLNDVKKPKSTEQQQPPLKRQNTGTPGNTKDREIRDFSASVGSKLSKKGVAEGRENVPLGASLGSSAGRVLRSRGS